MRPLGVVAAALAAAVVLSHASGCSCGRHDMSPDGSLVDAESGPFLDASARDASLPCVGPLSITPLAEPSPVSRTDVLGLGVGGALILGWTERRELGGSVVSRFGRIADVRRPSLVTSPTEGASVLSALVEAPESVYAVGATATGEVYEVPINARTGEPGAVAARSYAMDGLDSIGVFGGCAGAPLVPMVLCTSDGSLGVSLLRVGDAGLEAPFEQVFTTDGRLGTCDRSVGSETAETKMLACTTDGDVVSVLVRAGGFFRPLMVVQWTLRGARVPGTPLVLGTNAHVTGTALEEEGGTTWFAFGGGMSATVEAWRFAPTGAEFVAEAPLDITAARPLALGAVPVGGGVLVLFTQDGGGYTFALAYDSERRSLGLPSILLDVGLTSSARPITLDDTVYVPVVGALPGGLGLLRVCNGGA